MFRREVLSPDDGHAASAVDFQQEIPIGGRNRDREDKVLVVRSGQVQEVRGDLEGGWRRMKGKTYGGGLSLFDDDGPVDQLDGRLRRDEDYLQWLGVRASSQLPRNVGTRRTRRGR